jgi:hypothetical protein
VKIDDYGAHPQTEEELADYLRDLVDAPHDYDSSAQALHDGAVAAFNYMAHRLGKSSQASHAVLKLLGTVNGYRGPYGPQGARTTLATVACAATASTTCRDYWPDDSTKWCYACNSVSEVA